jgi:hypothetical protein
MNRLLLLVLGAAGVLLLPVSGAHADPFVYQMDWSQSTSEVSAGGAATGGVLFASPPSDTKGTGPGSVLIATVTSFSSATSPNPDTFTGQSYTMKGTFTDLASGDKGTVTFVGHLFGQLTATSGTINSTFDKPMSQQLKLGDKIYTITIGPFIGLNFHFDPGTGAALATPLPGTTGSVNAFVDIKPGRGGAQLPEPTTLALAGLGVGSLLALRRRRTSEAVA